MRVVKPIYGIGLFQAKELVIIEKTLASLSMSPRIIDTIPMPKEQQERIVFFIQTGPLPLPGAR